MAVERVGVEVDLGVEADQRAVLRHHERVDFEQAHVLLGEGLVELADHLHALLDLVALELQRGSDAAADVGRIARGGIDLHGDDLLGRGVRHFLDVHAAFGGGDEGNARGFTVDHDREIEFAGNGRAFLDVEALHELAFGAGLVRDQRHAQHAGGFGLHVRHRLHDLDAAALATAAGVDLRLDDPDGAAQRFGGLHRLVHIEGRDAAASGDAEAAEHFLGLVLMNVHVRSLVLRARQARSGAMVLAAAMRPWTASTDFLKPAWSSSFSAISAMRSTPFSPMTTGTPT